jgi:hypothetical protein
MLQTWENFRTSKKKHNRGRPIRRGQLIRWAQPNRLVLRSSPNVCRSQRQLDSPSAMLLRQVPPPLSLSIPNSGTTGPSPPLESMKSLCRPTPPLSPSPILSRRRRRQPWPLASAWSRGSKINGAVLAAHQGGQAQHAVPGAVPGCRRDAPPVLIPCIIIFGIKTCLTVYVSTSY